MMDTLFVGLELGIGGAHIGGSFGSWMEFFLCLYFSMGGCMHGWMEYDDGSFVTFIWMPWRLGAIFLSY
jgi:hypothetical protein